MRFVKYVSAAAEGSRWDVCGEYEVVMESPSSSSGSEEKAALKQARRSRWRSSVAFSEKNVHIGRGRVFNEGCESKREGDKEA